MNDIDRRLRVADPLAHCGVSPMSSEAREGVAQEIAMNSITEDRQASTASPRMPSDIRASRTRRRRRLLAAGLVTAGVLGVPTAAVAMRALPGSVSEAFSYWSDDPTIGVNADTATRVATGPGPDGTTFTVIDASNDTGLTCLAPLFETPKSAAEPAPTRFAESGSACFSTEQERGAFGVYGSVQGDDLVTFQRSAGDAVRAELRLPDGTARPALLVRGYLFGWYASTGSEEPALVGYAADGTKVGTFQMPALK